MATPEHQPRVKSKVYTRTGDYGASSLYNGERRSKTDEVFEAMGTVDETNSHIGVVLSILDVPGCGDEAKTLIKQLRIIQNRLFDVGTVLARYNKESACSSEISQTHIDMLELWIDELDSRNPKLTKFVLPGGSPASAAMNVARAVCRRAERHIFDLEEQRKLQHWSGLPLVTSFINRCYVLLCINNCEG